MPEGDGAIAIKVVDGIGQVPAPAWDDCAGPANPFVRHAFLKALEDSGAVTADTGWMPQHLVIEDETGQVAACAPLYLKGHSYGEFVFDWGWADAYERAGGRYYPKLQAAVPFTPVMGSRLLLRPGARPELRDALISGMVQLSERLEASSVHVTFSTEAEWQRMGEVGMLQRVGHQFHWENRDYGSFDDFLAALNSRKRKAIRKERQAANAPGDLVIRELRGDEIEDRHWDAFYRFYRNTSDRKWGPTYLNRDFFSLLHDVMADDVLLVLAEADGRPVAAALNLIGQDALYGRYWGCAERYKFLHFEACYYRAIDFAITHGLKRVEAGAQGPHKIQRGYLPRRTFSAHWIADSNFRDAIARYLAEERSMTELERQQLEASSPYRQC